MLPSTQCDRTDGVELAIVAQDVAAGWRLHNSSQMLPNVNPAALKKRCDCVKYVGLTSLSVAIRSRFLRIGRRRIDNIDVNSVTVASLARKSWRRFRSKRKPRYASLAYASKISCIYFICARCAGTRSHRLSIRRLFASIGTNPTDNTVANLVTLATIVEKSVQRIISEGKQKYAVSASLCIVKRVNNPCGSLYLLRSRSTIIERSDGN